MTVWTENSKIGSSIVVHVAIDVIDLDWAVSKNWILFTPTANRASFAIGSNPILDDKRDVLRNWCRRNLSARKPALQKFIRATNLA